MPVLATRTASSSVEPARRVTRAFPECANPGCASGWLQLLRKRRVPVVEGGWFCSTACTRARVLELLARESNGVRLPESYQHRIPIGLVLLTQGSITRDDLRLALEAQRSGSRKRLGEWLIAHRGLDEARLTQALGQQWSCPVFSLAKHGSPLPVTVVPRLLLESFGVIPLRLSPVGMLYLAFEDCIDHSLSLAIERMTGLRVESGLLSGSEFHQAQQRLRQSRYPRTRILEAASLDLLADAFTRTIEKEKPVETRLVRVRDFFWLRLWREATEEATGPMQDRGIEDVIGSITQFS